MNLFRHLLDKHLIVNKYISEGTFSKIYKGIYKHNECIIKKIKHDQYQNIEYVISSKTKNIDNLIYCKKKIQMTTIHI